MERQLGEYRVLAHGDGHVVSWVSGGQGWGTGYTFQVKGVAETVADFLNAQVHRDQIEGAEQAAKALKARFVANEIEDEEYKAGLAALGFRREVGGTGFVKAVA